MIFKNNAGENPRLPPTNTTLSGDDSKIDAVRTWKQPRTIKEVRALLGFCGFYRKFVRNFAQIANPLYDLLNPSYAKGFHHPYFTPHPQLGKT